MLTAIFEITAFPIFLTLLTLWVLSAVDYYPKSDSMVWIRENWPAILVSFALTLLVFFSVSAKFRLLADEPSFLAVSQSFFSQKLPRHIIMANFIDGQILPIEHILPHRPLLFPFMVSLMHTFLGYAVENAFYLNAGLLFFFFLLTYRIALAFLPKGIALAAPILVCAQPIVSSTAASAGFDLFSCLFLLYSIWLAKGILDHGTEKGLHHLALSLLMLTHIRYENALFAVIIIAYLFAIRRELALQLSGLRVWLFFYPLLLLPSVLQRAVVDSLSYQIPDGVAMFSVSHFLGHAQNLLGAFIDFGFYFPFATAINLFVLIFGLCLVIFRDRSFALLKQNKAALLLLGFVILSNLILMLAYFNGKPLHPASARYFLLFFALLSITFLFLLRFIFTNLHTKYYLAISVFLLVLYHPISVEGKFYFELTANRILEQQYDFLDRMRSINSNPVLVVAHNPSFFTIRKTASVSFDFYRKMNLKIRQWKEQKHVHEIIVFQEIDLRSGQPKPGYDLGVNFQLATIETHPVNESTAMRISKIID